MRPSRSSLQLLAALVSIIATTSIAAALDHPLSGGQLRLARKSGKERLVFLAKDPSLLFPAIGGPDDPSLVGVTVDIVPKPKQYPGLFSLSDGWTPKTGVRSSYKFKNDSTPGAATVRVQLVEGKQIRITAKSLGGLAVYPVYTTSFVVRITSGSLRNCVRFGPPSTVAYGDGFKFVAKERSAEVLADCSDASIGMPSECDFSSYPTCGGACPVGETCAGFGIDPGIGHCGCLPVGATQCGTPGVPTCGGACPSGEVCRPAFGLPVFGANLGCDCGAAEACGIGIECPNGFGCGYFPPQQRTCLPIFCGDYPSCSAGPCGDGGRCDAVSVGGGSGVCICAIPAPCDASCGGYGCSVGEVCATSSGTCGCQTP